MPSEDQLIAFLNEHQTCVVATSLPDGNPHAAVVSFSLEARPLQIYFCTDGRSIKAQNLMLNPHAALVVGGNKESWTTAQLRGQARPIVDQDLLELAQRRHFARHPGLERFGTQPQTIFFVFTPWWIRFSNFLSSPPPLSHFIVEPI